MRLDKNSLKSENRIISRMKKTADYEVDYFGEFDGWLAESISKLKNITKYAYESKLDSSIESSINDVIDKLASIKSDIARNRRR